MADYNSPPSKACFSDISDSFSGVINLCIRDQAPTSTYVHNFNRTSPVFVPKPIPMETIQSDESRSSLCSLSGPSSPGRIPPRGKLNPRELFRPYAGPPYVPVSSLLDPESENAFVEFRNRVKSQLQPRGPGTNQNMRRMGQNSQTQNSDPAYLEKRRKNNEAAKRSRDARRQKEEEISIRSAFLEHENLTLKFKVRQLEARLKQYEYVHE